jgi:exonuclease III
MFLTVLTYNTHGLPWSRDTSVEICDWLKMQRPQVICLQEVFVEANRKYYKEHLERNGYHVLIPRDSGVALVNSGLLMAFLTVRFDYVSDCFYPYLDYHNVEIFANKGFHAVTIRERVSRRVIVVANTHMQSDTELELLFGRKVTYDVRKAQHQQILKALTTPNAVLVVGDMNCERSPEPLIRYMTHVDESRLKKATFYSTGEDLDHVAWFPLQWARPNCQFCDFVRRGPRLLGCQIFQKPWSDHAPVVFSIFLPLMLSKKG